MGIFSSDEEPTWSDVFTLQDKIKRLQEENKSLQMLSCANCGEKYLSPDGAELYDENVRLQEENEELKNRLKTLDDEEFVYEVTEIEYNNFKKMNKYKQALEEIREMAEICMSKNIDNCYTCKFYNECEIEDAEIPTRDVCKLIKNKINEVLNDRD